MKTNKKLTAKEFAKRENLTAARAIKATWKEVERLKADPEWPENGRKLIEEIKQLDLEDRERNLLAFREQFGTFEDLVYTAISIGTYHHVNEQENL